MTLERRYFTQFQQEGSALSTSNPGLSMMGGVYRSSLPTYTNGQAAMFHFTQDGKLMVDTELVLDGNVIIDNIGVYATDINNSYTIGFGLIDAQGHVQVDVISSPGSGAQHNVAVVAAGEHTIYEAKDFDGAVLPNNVIEGRGVRGAATLYGLAYSFLANEDGSKTPIVAHDAAISDANGGTVGVMVAANARTSQLAAVANNDATRFVTNEHGEVVLAGYNWAGQYVRTNEVNPIDQKYSNTPIEEVTNITTAIDADQYVYFSMDGYQHFSVQVTLSDGTVTDDVIVTIEATNDTSNANPASLTYTDVSEDIFGAAYASGINNVTGAVDKFFFADTSLSAHYFRLVYSRTAGAGDDADVDLRVKRWY